MTAVCPHRETAAGLAPQGTHVLRAEAGSGGAAEVEVALAVRAARVGWVPPAAERAAASGVGPAASVWAAAGWLQEGAAEPEEGSVSEAEAEGYDPTNEMTRELELSCSHNGGKEAVCVCSGFPMPAVIWRCLEPTAPAYPLGPSPAAQEGGLHLPGH